MKTIDKAIQGMIASHHAVTRLSLERRSFAPGALHPGPDLAPRLGLRPVVNAPHLVALVKVGVEFPDGEAEMLKSEPAPADLFTDTPSVFAASEVSIHKI